MSNIIDFDDYALEKDPESIWVEKYAEMVRPYLHRNHLQSELEFAATKYYRAINKIGHSDWTFNVDCYVGVPDYVGLFFEIAESHVNCLKVPLGFIIQLGILTGNSYAFAIILERKNEDDDQSNLLIIHTEIQDFLEECSAFEKDIMDGVEPWDEDQEKFQLMYIEKSAENAWAKKQHVALRLFSSEEDRLKARILHQILSIGLLFADKSDLVNSEIERRRGEDEELSEIYSSPDVDILWSLGSGLPEFKDYFTNVDDFTDDLRSEVEFWSPALIWKIKDDEARRRWEYAKLTLQNSDVEFEPFYDFYED